MMLDIEETVRRALAYSVVFSINNFMDLRLLIIHVMYIRQNIVCEKMSKSPCCGCQSCREMKQFMCRFYHSSEKNNRKRQPRDAMREIVLRVVYEVVFGIKQLSDIREYMWYKRNQGHGQRLNILRSVARKEYTWLV
jgi:hypothetical protein